MEAVAKALDKAAKELAALLEQPNVEHMRPSDIIVSVANVLDQAAKDIEISLNERD